jgi:phage-related protein
LYNQVTVKDVGGTPAEIHWEGDSKETLSGFPRDVKLGLGYSLRRLQNGEFPACETRSMPSIGKGVWELKESDERAWYRVVYLSKIGSVIMCCTASKRKAERRTSEISRPRELG